MPLWINILLVSPSSSLSKAFSNKSSSHWCPVHLFDEDIASLDGLDEKFDVTKSACVVWLWTPAVLLESHFSRTCQWSHWVKRFDTGIPKWHFYIHVSYAYQQTHINQGYNRMSYIFHDSIQVFSSARSLVVQWIICRLGLRRGGQILQAVT